tara:strand:+ start:5401 stop:5694 length:294 start_codon:yes stop_codon:yes gene_type:complete
MGEKIIYINNVNNFPDIHKKQWILKKTDNLKFVYNLSTRDTIWFVIIKAFKKEIYYGKIAIIIKNNKKNIIIFDNINKIDEGEEIYSSIENNNRLII